MSPAQAQTAPPAAAPSSRPRDPWLDNTKMVLVTLVVVGHGWGQMAATEPRDWVYDFLYFWHIPAFVFISGYLSKSFEWDAKHLRSLVYTIVIPYLIFEPLLYGYRYLLLGEREEGILWLEPHWAMWYLAVLFWWRLMTPILKRHWLFVPLSVVIGIVGGLWSVDLFFFSRILGLLPFFVLGLHLKPHHLKRLDDPWVRLAGLAGLVALFLVSRYTDEFARTALLYYDTDYSDLGYDAVPGMQNRLTVMGLGAIGAFSVLALVPRRNLGWFTAMGSATMIVYLFHGFFVRLAGFAGLGEWSETLPWLWLLIVTVAGVAVSLFLACPPVRRVLVWAVDPVNSWQRSRRPGAN